MIRKKTGGRKKGKLNRRTEFGLPLVDQMRAGKFDLVTEIIRLYPQLEPPDQADMLVRLMEFVFPKKKSITVEEAQRVLNEDLVRKGIVLDSITEDVQETTRELAQEQDPEDQPNPYF